MAASETTGTGVVVDAVDDAHRDGARDEDVEQPHPPTTSAENVNTVVASETTSTDVVVDVVEDPRCDNARDDHDGTDDYFWNDDDGEVLDVNNDDDDEELEVLTPSRDQTNKHSSNSQLKS